MNRLLTGKTEASKKGQSTPYDKAVAACKNVLSDSLQFENAPCSIGKLIIEEAFYILHTGALYSGMGEENLSACFVNSLVSAEILWRRQWIWSSELPEKIIWAHYPDRTETFVGADFSLTRVDKDPNTGKSRFRMIIAQAKKLTAKTPKLIDVKRKAFSTLNQGSKSPDWRALANENLQSAFDVEFEATRYEVTYPNWQISRLLYLRDRFKENQIPAPSMIYVAWPATPTNATGPFKPVLYEKLDQVSEQVKMKKQAGGSYVQSFAVDERKLFRNYLLDFDEATSMSEVEFIKAVDLAKIECSALILLNDSGHDLSPELTAILNRLAPTPPPYSPSAPAASVTSPTFG